MTTVELQAKCAEYKEYKRMIEELEGLVSGIGDELKAFMRESEQDKVICGQYKVSVSEVTKNTVDAKKLEVEQPDIYTAYKKSLSYMRLLVS